MGPSPSQVRIGLVLWVVAAAAFSFAPFRAGYHGPKLVENGASWTDDGALTLSDAARVRTEGPPEWLAEAIAAEELTVTVTARTAGPDQRGPARLLTVSNGAFERNFMVAQQGVDLFVRARRPGADENGAPPLKVDGVFAESGLRAFEVRFARESIEVYVDGVQRCREQFTTSPFEGWDPRFELALGDEVDGARGWRGELTSATANVGDQVWDLLRSDRLERPSTFWDVPEATRQLLRFDPSQAWIVFLLHACLFLPLGGLLPLTGLAVWRRPVGVLCVAALAGLLFQLGKLGFDARHPSVYHVLPDGLGALVGTLLTRRLWPPSP